MFRKIIFIISVITAFYFGLLKPINNVIQIWVPIVAFLISYVGLTALLFGFLYIWSLFYHKQKVCYTQNKLVHFFTIRMIEWICDCAHVKVVTKNFELIPHDQKYMLIGNHVSRFDPMLMSVILRQDNVIQVTKPENCKIPLAGNFIVRDCYISLNRNDNREALKSILRAVDFVKEGKFSVGIYPEGTRNKGDEYELQDFRPGCFNIATRSHCPIVITALDNTFNIHKNFPFKRTKVEIRVVGVLYYEDYKDLTTTEISKICRNLMQQARYEQRDQKKH